MKRKIKPKGHWEECPVCDGTGACKIYTFDEAKWLMDMKDGELRGHLVANGIRYKVYLHIEEAKNG